ncbi:MAG: permease [Bacillota bacterium]|nr:permease [Bacillota bacterium]
MELKQMIIEQNELLINIMKYAGELILRVVPMLVAAIFIAESARRWFGDEKLKALLAGSGIWSGRLRAAALGAVLPFCECGAFPVVLGLIRAGVPTSAVLTFFLVSPVVSMPAFLILSGIFGFPVAFFYLLITAGAAIIGGVFLEKLGGYEHIFKPGIALIEERDGIEPSNLKMAADNSSSTGFPSVQPCCTIQQKDMKTEVNSDIRVDIVKPAWHHTLTLLKKILPYVAIVIIVSALLRNLVPPDLIQQALESRAPFDIIIGALLGIPIYAGDCSMIALAAPLIGATGALGAGIAFIISGSGTSVSGIIFMSSLFKRRFLFLYVFTVFCIAVTAGYLISLLPLLGVL